MNKGVYSIVYPVKDLAQAKTFYRQFFGVEPYADVERYVGFQVGDQRISLDPNGDKRGYTGPVAVWAVDDIKQTLQILLDAGAHMHEELRETSEPGTLIASVKDTDGNIIGLRQSRQSL